MAPQLPDRYRPLVRLGADGDVEEWLATDTALDRPVLARIVGPWADADRRGRFLASVRAAGGVAHVHLASVFAAGAADDTAYAVMEWNGGISIADRLASDETIPVDEFLPNAAGLADGLATLHGAGAVHGGIDPSAIHFSAAHPAKLGAYGRARPGASMAADTRALAETLRMAVAGTAVPGLSPSEVAEDLAPSVDRALQRAAGGDLDAAGLGRALRTARSTPPPAAERPWSWRWMALAGALFVLALVVALIGLAIDVDPDSPFLFPAAPAPVPAPVPTTAIGSAADAGPRPDAAGALSYGVAVHDPFGDGTESDESLAFVSDGDPDSFWRTERYFSDLSGIKPGVGLRFSVGGDPTSLEMVASPGTRYTIAWAGAEPAEHSGWEETTSGTVVGGRTRVQLPDRRDGQWLLWLTELPAQEQGQFFYAAVNEVRFLRERADDSPNPGGR